MSTPESPETPRVDVRLELRLNGFDVNLADTPMGGRLGEAGGNVVFSPSMELVERRFMAVEAARALEEFISSGKADNLLQPQTVREVPTDGIARIR